ncbi:hypothetical protein [Bacillus taeanensis]|uniref:Uncharacterized protein n=1 Tax=Bacillus taeanensis TaxID=273032 RepID=A0A366XZR6_9BACI|nr:hypothetical protein [Bacillus taeanensis]RBW71427.1 hypothetical protein DS031_01375 [Bacillus taeanensis]
MKKRLFALLTVLLVIASMSGVASAETASKEMTKAISANLEEQHSDYVQGSLSLENVEEVQVNDSEKDFNSVVLAVAHYKTVRDNIFFTNRAEVVYFDAANNTVLGQADVATIEAAANYKDVHSEELGSHLDMWVITLLNLVVPLLIMAFIMYLWEPRQYLTTRFKIANKLYNGHHQSFN